MAYDEANACDNRYSQGEDDGRKDGAMHWGQRDVSNDDPFYAQGYSDGYNSTFAL